MLSFRRPHLAQSCVRNYIRSIDLNLNFVVSRCHFGLSSHLLQLPDGSATTQHWASQASKPRDLKEKHDVVLVILYRWHNAFSSPLDGPGLVQQRNFIANFPLAAATTTAVLSVRTVIPHITRTYCVDRHSRSRILNWFFFTLSSY